MITRTRLVVILLAAMAGIVSAINVGLIGVTSVTVGSGASLGALLLLVAFLQLAASLLVAVARNTTSACALAMARDVPVGFDAVLYRREAEISTELVAAACAGFLDHGLIVAVAKHVHDGG